MFTNAVKVLTVRGIDIRIDVSWLVIAALITWSFWGQFTIMYDQEGTTALAMAVIGAVLFFSSVLAHELAHALEAQRRGVTVGGITLFMFGGVTESKFDVRRPVDEFSLTVVGPLTSFALAGIFWFASITAAGADLPAVAQVAGLLGWINLALGIFNLIPGAPLDGGRILRAAVWKVTGDRQRSIRVAAQAGRVVGGLLIVLGILQVLFVEGALFGGLWLALIGWFLTRGAAAELAQAQLVELFEGVPARRVAVRGEPATRREPIRHLLERWADGDAPDVLPVVADDGAVVGVVSVDDVSQRPAAERDTTAVEDVMVHLDELPSLDADEPAGRAFEGIQERGVVVLTDHGRPVGVITAERLVAVAQRRARAERPEVAGRTPL